MHPAPVTPGRSIPPALYNSRQVCDSIKTWQVSAYDRMVSATASCKIRVVHPDQAPVFMSMVPDGFGHDGPGRGFTGWWEGRGMVQIWAADELAALARLFTTLEGLDLPVPWEARDVHAALTAVATTRPTHDTWPSAPLGLRGKRPRRGRHAFKSPLTGKITRFYKDTLRAHADPDCQCPHCNLTTPTTDENTTT